MIVVAFRDIQQVCVISSLEMMRISIFMCGTSDLNCILNFFFFWTFNSRCIAIPCISFASRDFNFSWAHFERKSQAKKDRVINAPWVLCSLVCRAETKVNLDSPHFKFLYVNSRSQGTSRPFLIVLKYSSDHCQDSSKTLMCVREVSFHDVDNPRRR